MTLPSPLSELDEPSESEPELSRITVLVGSVRLDVGVPSHISVAAVIDDTIQLADAQLPPAGDLEDVEFDHTEGRWTFARIGGDPIDPDRTLAEVGVYDGDVLVVQQIGAPTAPLLFDDVEHAADPAARGRRWYGDNEWAATWFGLSIALAGVVALLLPGQVPLPAVPGIPVAAIASLLLGLGCAVAACVLPYRGAGWARSAWLAGVALPLIFGAALQVVPGGHGAAALPMACGLTALAALVVLLISGRGRTLYTAVIALALLGVLASVPALLLHPSERTVGAVLATASVIAIYLAPRATILLSKLPVPRVPTAGEPLDDIETQGGTAVEGVNAIGKQIIPTEEGMVERVRRANDYLTGIITAAALAAVIGCYLAVDVSNGFFWQGSAFAIAVGTVLCLRGRSHHDLVQAATLIGGGLLTVLAMIAKTATFLDDWQINAALLLVALALVVVGTGLVAPRLEFSPVMRRRAELLEVFAVAMVFPLACWIIRLYAFFREMRI